MNDSVSEATASEQSSVETSVSTALTEKPDFLNEKFWPDGGGEPLSILENLSQSYAELETRIRSKEEDISDRLKSEIENSMFEGVPTEASQNNLSLPEDFGLEINTEDPLLDDFRQFAHQHKLSQDVGSGIFQLYGNSMKAALPDPEAEKKLIGEDFDGRMSRMEASFKANLDPEDYEAVSSMQLTAKSFRAMEKLASMLAPGGVNHSDFDGGSLPLGDQDAAQLRSKIDELQGSDAYWGQSSNPAEIDRVRNEVGRLQEQLSGGRQRRRQMDGSLGG